MNNRFVVILLALIIGFAGIFWFTKSKDSNGSNGQSNSTTATSHTTGANKMNVTFIEYGDFQCPACGQYYPLVKQVKEKYKDDISFQFRHFPLTQIHPHAMIAARAAEAAGKQNKFWEMHDLLFEQQQSWSTSSSPASIFEGYAQQLKLDVARFKQDMASTAVNDAINADIAEAKKAGANSTPTFVLNGQKLEENPRDLDGFSKLIDEAIKNQQP